MCWDLVVHLPAFGDHFCMQHIDRVQVLTHRASAMHVRTPCAHTCMGYLLQQLIHRQPSCLCTLKRIIAGVLHMQGSLCSVHLAECQAASACTPHAQCQSPRHDVRCNHFARGSTMVAVLCGRASRRCSGMDGDAHFCCTSQSDDDTCHSTSERSSDVNTENNGITRVFRRLHERGTVP